MSTTFQNLFGILVVLAIGGISLFVFSQYYRNGSKPWITKPRGGQSNKLTVIKIIEKGGVVQSLQTIANLSDAPFLYFGLVGENVRPFNDLSSFHILALPSKDFENMAISVLSSQHLFDIFTCQMTGKGIEADSCTQLIIGNSSLIDISHIYLKRKPNELDEFSILVAKLYDVSKKHQLCYGLPRQNFSISPSNLYYTNECPACICSSIFDVNTVSKDLKIDIANAAYKDLLFKISRSSALLAHSRFIPCTNLQKTMSKPSDAFLVGDSKELGALNVLAVRQALLNLGMPSGIHGGTLLGWYRNCSVIAKDPDVDLMKAYVNRGPVSFPVLYGENKAEFNLRVSRLFGDFKSGIEFRFSATQKGGTAVGVDIFTLYIDQPDYEYSFITGFDFSKRAVLRYALPKNVTLCSAIFFGEIFLVPCEPEPYLSRHYGSDWRTPKSGTKWTQLPNIQKVDYPVDEWKRRIMYHAF